VTQKYHKSYLVSFNMQICHNTEVQSVETSGSHRLEVSVS